MAVPLMFSVVFVFLMTMMLVRIDAEIASEAASKAIMATSGDFSRHMTNAFAAATALRIRPSKIQHMRLDRGLQLAAADLTRLKMHAAGREAEQSYITELESCLRETTRVLNKVANLPAEGGDVLALMSSSLTDETKTAINRAKQAMAALVQMENEQDVRNLEQLHATKAAITVLIGGGAILSVALSVSLTVFFARSIGGRLRRVAQTANKVAKREELGEPVPGGDEIAQLDAQLRRIDADLTDNERMRQRLISFVGHELKSPLTALSGIYALVSAPQFSSLPEPSLKLASEASDNLEELTALIIDLIDIERMRGKNVDLLRSDTDLGYVIETAAEELAEKAAAKNITIAIEAVSDTMLVADKSKIERAVRSLLRNSIARSPQGGKILMRLSETGCGTNALLSISDDGQPLPPEVTDMLVSGDAKDENLEFYVAEGFPLLIAKLIIERHGGLFKMQSSESGCTFLCQLPIDKELAES